MGKKKKVVYNDKIYVSVIVVERLRQTALRNGLKDKRILGQQKIIITPVSLSLRYMYYFTVTSESRIKLNNTGTFPQAEWVQFV